MRSVVIVDKDIWIVYSVTAGLLSTGSAIMTIRQQLPTAKGARRRQEHTAFAT